MGRCVGGTDVVLNNPHRLSSKRLYGTLKVVVVPGKHGGI